MSKSKNMRDHASDLAERIAPHVESARDKAVPMLADARDKAAPYVADARDKAAPYVADARAKAAPYVADARAKAGPVIADAKGRITHDVVPVITAAIAAAGEATEDVRGEVKKRGLATAAALKGEVAAPQTQTHRVRKLFIVLGLGGVVAVIARKLSSRQPSTTWQSSYTPPPAPASSTSSVSSLSDETPTATATAAAFDQGLSESAEPTTDEGAAGPDEAASDATDVPHAATTPDSPVEETHLKRD